jgi:hypothetical protein
MSPGWIKQSHDFVSRALPSFKRYTAGEDSELKSLEKRAEMDEIAYRVTALEDAATSKMQIYGPRVGTLPDGVGEYRVFLPLFALEDGLSMHFLDQADGLVRSLPDGKLIAAPSAVRQASWRGFSASGLTYLKASGWENLTFGRVEIPLIFEINVVQKAKISIDRELLDVEDDPSSIESAVVDAGMALFREFVSEKGMSPFAALSRHWVKLLGNDAKEMAPYWLLSDRENNQRYRFRKPEWPALLVPAEITYYRPWLSEERLKENGFRDELRPLGLSRGFKKLWPLSGLGPSRMILFGSQPCLVYEDLQPAKLEGLNVVQCPPEWEDLLAITEDEFIVYNENHFLCKQVNGALWNSFKDFSQGKTVESLIREIASSSSKFAAPLFLSAAGYSTEYWNALRDNFRSAFTTLFELIEFGKPDATRIAVWRDQYEGGLRHISPTGAKFTGGYLSRRPSESILPMPRDPYWFLKQ